MSTGESIFIGFMFGALSMGILMAATDGLIKSKLITECELNLPRIEKCVLIAVPEKETGK